jgi:hypothetical protein
MAAMHVIRSGFLGSAMKWSKTAIRQAVKAFKLFDVFVSAWHPWPPLRTRGDRFDF